MQNTILSTVLAAAVATTLSAQTPSRVLGLTNATPFLMQLNPTNCGPSLCPAPVGPAVTPWAGGVAHDPRDRNTWISDGVTLAKVDPRNGCALICSSIAPLVVPGLVVTGLAANEETQQLFISYSNNTIATFPASGCTLGTPTICTLALPPNHIVSGLATEDSTGEIYYVSGPWGGASSVPFARVYRALQTAPCVPLCNFDVFGCDPVIPSDVTGLGFDACRRELYITAGNWLYTVTDTWLCTQTYVNCCFLPTPPAEPLTGLCVLPSTEVSIGNPCTGGVAPLCPNLSHTLRGDPTIGNLGFALDLNNAPTNSIAYCFLGLGPCAGGSTYGVLCNLLMPTFLYHIAFVPPGPPCGGNLSCPFPIPNVPSLCGIILSSQFAGEIPPSFAGNYTTNCLSWMISAS